MEFNLHERKVVICTRKKTQMAERDHNSIHVSLTCNFFQRTLRPHSTFFKTSFENHFASRPE
jgi:hypothetical protein